MYKEPNVIQEVGARYTDWLGDIRGNYRGEERLTNKSAFKVDYTAACSTLLRKSVVVEIGRFADIFIFYDDIDWALRASRSGYSIWAVPDSVVRHNFGGVKPQQLWREYYRKRNRAYCLSQHPTKRLGYFALYIYLIFVNYLQLSNRYAGSPQFAHVYGVALHDFLNGTMGKSDRDEIYAAPPNTINGDESGHAIQAGLLRFARIAISVSMVPLGFLRGNLHFLKHSLFMRKYRAPEIEFRSN